MDKEKVVTYVAELDADVDDVVAAHYLFNRGVLKEVVCDPMPVSYKGKERLKMLEDLGIKVSYKLEGVHKYVFVGGALTELARFISLGNRIDTLVMNGGFVGSNIVKESDQLDKFKNKEVVRTFNFNCDVVATDFILRTKNNQIGTIVLVGKNVCHSDRNSYNELWNNDECKELFIKYGVRFTQHQHDMLACHEGLAFLELINDKNYCEFMEVKPYNTGLNCRHTLWGSKSCISLDTPYRACYSAIRFSI